MNSVESKHILVTGGSGFIGKALCSKLLENGAQVTVLTRNIKSTGNKLPKTVTLIDSLNDFKPEKAVDIIINLAGQTIATKWTDTLKEEILNSRVNTTASLIEYIKKTKTKPKLLISGSAIGYYGTDLEQEFSEDDYYHPNQQDMFTIKLCHLWEKEAQKAQDLGVRTCFLRTGVVLEKDGGTLAKLLPAFKLGLGGKISNGKQWFSWIHRDDIIGIILHIINNGKINGAVNGSAPNPVTNADFTKALAKALKRPALFTVPGCFLKAAFGQMAEEIMLEGQKVIPQKIINSGYKFKYPEINQALGAIFNK